MELPLTKTATEKCANWMRNNFYGQIKEVTRGTPWTADLIISIALKETAQKWQMWIDDYSKEEILARCVFDASGDFPGTSRAAFPKNRQAFEKVYGPELTAMLVNEANLTRRMPQPDDKDGYKPASYLYKGYGIFQYDLQHITTNPTFFTEKRWYNFTDCLWNCVEVLNDIAKTRDNLRGIVKAYNGTGQRADEYADSVLAFMQIV